MTGNGGMPSVELRVQVRDAAILSVAAILSLLCSSVFFFFLFFLGMLRATGLSVLIRDGTKGLNLISMYRDVSSSLVTLQRAPPPLTCSVGMWTLIFFSHQPVPLFLPTALFCLSCQQCHWVVGCVTVLAWRLQYERGHFIHSAGMTYIATGR